jgi:hypothetical protein
MRKRSTLQVEVQVSRHLDVHSSSWEGRNTVESSAGKT